MFDRFTSLLVVLAVAGIGVHADRAAHAETHFGEAQKMGDGTVRTYVIVLDDGQPTTIGISFTASLLDGLPSEPNPTSRCFDTDGDGRLGEHECEGDHEVRLPLSPALAGRADLPFRWVGINWNPHGHPPGAWSVPHFDVHFYMVDQGAIDAIRVGPCEFFIDCEDRERALRPVDPAYVHPDHVSVGATVAMMGNHLIDSHTPELAEADPEPFTHTWIFGAYDGQITFYEPMITREYLLSRPDGCTPIKQPTAWQRAGWYPTEYCIRYSEPDDAYTVSLEEMVYREAH